MRSLVSVGFLEGVAIENRIVDPAMRVDSGDTWLFTDLSSMQVPARVNKAALPRTPAGQAALFVGSAANPNGAALIGTFKIPAGSYVASIWCGAATTDRLGVQPATLTFDTNGANNPRAVELSPDDPSRTQDLDGLHWVHYSANVSPDVVAGLGYLYIAVQDPKNDLWVAGPEVLERPMPSAQWKAPRALHDDEVRFVGSLAFRRRPVPELPNHRRRY
jgi:hypothetical protein